MQRPGFKRIGGGRIVNLNIVKPTATFRSVLASFNKLFIVIFLIVGMAVVSVSAQNKSSIKASLVDRSLLLDATSVDGRVIAVGERGHILISNDGGNSWGQANVPSRGAVTGVYFHDKSLGWAVTYYQEILRTKDGGENWEKVYTNTGDERPLLDIWFKDATHGIAVGAYGLYIITVDGGNTWSPQVMKISESSNEQDSISDDEMAFLDAFGTDNEFANLDDLEEDEGYELCLNNIVSNNKGTLFIAAEIGTIYRSDDDGQTWASLTSPYQGSFFCILPLDEDSLLLLGLRGHMFRSDDKGDSWQEIETETDSTLMGGIRLDDGSIVVTGLEGTILLSRDGGYSFKGIRHPSRKDIITAATPDGKTVILIGQFGAKKYSIDNFFVKN